MDDLISRRHQRWNSSTDPPDSATGPTRPHCSWWSTTWRALYDGLRTFRQDLTTHIHTENTILFERFAPAAVV